MDNKGTILAAIALLLIGGIFYVYDPTPEITGRFFDFRPNMESAPQPIYAYQASDADDSVQEVPGAVVSPQNGGLLLRAWGNVADFFADIFVPTTIPQYSMYSDSLDAAPDGGIAGDDGNGEEGAGESDDGSNGGDGDVGGDTPPGDATLERTPCKAKGTNNDLELPENIKPGTKEAAEFCPKEGQCPQNYECRLDWTYGIGEDNGGKPCGCEPTAAYALQLLSEYYAKNRICPIIKKVDLSKHSEDSTWSWPAYEYYDNPREEACQRAQEVAVNLCNIKLAPVAKQNQRETQRLETECKTPPYSCRLVPKPLFYPPECSLPTPCTYSTKPCDTGMCRDKKGNLLTHEYAESHATLSYEYAGQPRCIPK